MVVHHRMGARCRRQRIRHSGDLFSQSSARCREQSQPRSRRASCCLRTPRSPTLATASFVMTSGRRARALASPKPRSTTTDVRIGDWSLRLADGRYVARIAAQDFRFDLRFTPTQHIMLRRRSGLLTQGPATPPAPATTTASRNSRSQGAIAIGGRTADVKGTAWLDHEWSSEAMAAGAIGWDWIGINLHDGGSLMAFRMRDRTGNALWAGGTLRAADGTSTRFGPGDIVFTARAAMAFTAHRRRVSGGDACPCRRQRLHARAADGRSGTGFARQHRHDLLGGRGPHAARTGAKSVAAISN